MRLDPDMLPYNVKRPFVNLLHAIRSANLTLLEEHRPDRNFSSLQQTSSTNTILLVNLLLEGLWKLSRVEDAERTFQELLGQGMRPTFVTVEIMLDGALRHGRVETAQSLDAVYGRYGLWPSTGHFNHWISFHLGNSQLDQAHATLQQMRLAKQRPNATTFNIFLKYFIKWSDWAAAERIQLSMDREGISPNLLYYCSLLRALFLKNSLSDVQAALEKASPYLQRADRPSRYAFYNSVVEGYARCGDLKLVQAYLEEMRKCECPPNVTTYNRVIDAAANALTNDQLKAIVAEMDSAGISSNPYTLAAIAKAVMRQGRKQEAMAFLVKLKHEPIPITTIGDLMQRCIDHDLPEGIAVLKECLRLNGLTPNGYIYSLLLRKALVQRNMPEANSILLQLEAQGLVGSAMPTNVLVVLMEYFVENMHLDRIQTLIQWMQTARIVINKRIQGLVHKTFYVHLKLSEGGMLTHAKLNAASNNLNNELRPLGNRLPESVLVYLRKSRDGGRATLQVVNDFEQVMDLPFQLSVHEFNDVLLQLLRAQQHEAFLNALKDMDQLGIIPNLFTLTLAIKCRLALGQSKLAHRTLREAGRHGLTPTVYQCALVFHHHCRLGLTGAAEALLEEMIGFWRLKPNHVFYAALIYAYHRSKDNAAIFATFERMERHGFIPDTETCNYLLKSMLDLGREEEAQSFLERMAAQKIARNPHTYRFFVDRLVPRGQISKAMDLLTSAMEDPDALLDAKPFARFSYHLCEMADIDNLVKLFDLYVRAGACFSEGARTGLRFVFYHHLSLKNMEMARVLLEKAHLDYTSYQVRSEDETPTKNGYDNDHIPDYTLFLEMLENDYLQVATNAEKATWSAFKQILPELREYLHRLSPAIEAVNILRPEDIYLSVSDITVQDDSKQTTTTSISGSSEFDLMQQQEEEDRERKDRTTDDILDLLNNNPQKL